MKTEFHANGRLTLRPATLSDREKIFNWLTNSNLTEEMLGPPKFPDTPIPTWKDFIDDYLEYYFNGSEPLKGRCFIINHDGIGIGQINYNEIENNATELTFGWLTANTRAKDLALKQYVCLIVIWIKYTSVMPFTSHLPKEIPMHYGHTKKQALLRLISNRTSLHLIMKMQY